jgi:hypothetical protein
MATEDQRTLYIALHESRNRLTYYLLTAAAAGIALAVNQTRGVALARSQLPLGLATLSWAFSFLFGYLRVRKVNSLMYSNSELLGERPVVSDINQTMKRNATWAARFDRLQFDLLIVGAILFVVWHIWEMYLRRAS